MPRHVLGLSLLVSVGLLTLAPAQQTALPVVAPPTVAPDTVTPPSVILAPSAAPATDVLEVGPPGAGLLQSCEGRPNLENSCTQLVRKGDDGKERRIVIVRTGTSDETGIDGICGPRDNEPDTVPSLLVLSESGPGGIEISIDKNLIRVPLAVVTKRNEQADGQTSKKDERIEASAGTARALDEVPEGKTDRLSLCGLEVTPKPTPDTVLVTQGKTELKGQKLVYDETDGIARVEGPITFKRTNEKDPLTGRSERIEVNVDEEKTTLVGGVVLNSEGGRVSKAARVEYDDTKNVARLFGTPEQPAESVKGNDKLSAGVILYDLDKNEVVAAKGNAGNITGEFQDGEDTSSGTPPASTPTKP